MVLPTQASSSQVHNFDGVGYRLSTHLAWVGLNLIWLCGRSQTNEWFSCGLARLGSTVWPPADASFDFVTWLELGVLFGQGLILHLPWTKTSSFNFSSAAVLCSFIWSEKNSQSTVHSGTWANFQTFFSRIRSTYGCRFLSRHWWLLSLGKCYEQVISRAEIPSIKWNPCIVLSTLAEIQVPVVCVWTSMNFKDGSWLLYIFHMGTWWKNMLLKKYTKYICTGMLKKHLTPGWRRLFSKFKIQWHCCALWSQTAVYHFRCHFVPEIRLPACNCLA